MYRDGVLEAEDFPVADVSEHLEGRHGGLGRLLRAVEGGAARARRRARPARARGRGRARPAPAAQARPLRDAPVPVVPRRAREQRRGELDGPRSTRSSTRGGSSPSARTRVLDRRRCSRRWDRSADLAGHGVGFLLYGLLDVVVDGYFDAVAGVRRLLRRGERGDLLRDTRSIRRSSATGSRCAGRWCASTASSVPMREAVSGLMRREHDRRRRASCIRTSRTCTTTSCASASRPTRCATSSARSSRPTSACATTARTRS